MSGGGSERKPGVGMRGLRWLASLTGLLVGLGAGCAGNHVVGAAGLVEVAGQPLDTTPLQLAVGDFDGDQQQDVAILGLQSQLCWLRGNGQLGFAFPSCGVLAAPASHLAALATGPMTASWLVAAGSAVTLLRAQNDGQFAAHSSWPVVGATTSLMVPSESVGGSDASDLLVLSAAQQEAALFLHPSSGLLPPVRYPTMPEATAAWLADLDGDHSPELVVIGGGRALPAALTGVSARGPLQFARCASGRTQPALQQPTGVATGDIDGDGRPELLISDAATHTLLVLHIQPSAGFVLDCGDDTGGRLQLPADPQALVVADLDQDGRADVLVLHREPGLLSLAMGSPTGLLAPVTFPVGSTPQALAVADLQHDGLPEVLVLSPTDRLLRIFRSAFR